MAKIHVSMLQTMAVASLLAACSGNDPTTDQQSALGGRVDDFVGFHGKGHDVTVMTRNLYLGANLAPAINATDVGALVEGAGVILRQVTANDFPVRAKGLAAEIRRAQPDLVALQECALWRTGPVDFEVLTTGPSAKDVRYDYLQLLLDELNRGHDEYEAVAINEEFDFEVPADEDGDPKTGTLGADLNGRLTMRDVILARVGVHVWRPEGGHFQHLLTLPVLQAPPVSVAVTRGWVKVEARVRDGLPFRFVATHLEAFDNGEIRALQAGELVNDDGPATSERVVLAGDMNSGNARDNVSGNDRLAYATLVSNGMYERSTNHPFSCCIEGDDLTAGTASDFDHRVDHIMTNAPYAVRLVDSFVTGRTMHHGYWDSDHAGVVSELRIEHGHGRSWM